MEISLQIITQLKEKSENFPHIKVYPQNSATSFNSIYQIVKNFPTCLLCSDRLLMSSKLFTKKKRETFFVPFPTLEPVWQSFRKCVLAKSSLTDEPSDDEQKFSKSLKIRTIDIGKKRSLSLNVIIIARSFIHQDVNSNSAIHTNEDAKGKEEKMTTRGTINLIHKITIYLLSLSIVHTMTLALAIYFHVIASIHFQGELIFSLERE
jgi:hypothetical protein